MTQDALLAESYTNAQADLALAVARFDRGEVPRSVVDAAREHANACCLRANPTAARPSVR